MVDPVIIDAIDDMLTVNSVGGLAGLSLVTFTLLTSRVQNLEQEAGMIKIKRGGGDAYAKSIMNDMARLRLAARLAVYATIALLASAILMFVAFDSFAEADASENPGRALLDVVLTGTTFLFGLLALLVAAIALGWDYLTG